MRVYKTSEANRDLKKLYKAVKAFDRRAAQKMLARLDAAFLRLSDYPFSGVEWNEVEQGLRRVISGLNVIIYRVEKNRILILRVLDGRMDIEAEFVE
jgi:toxin ParE1/3/4